MTMQGSMSFVPSSDCDMSSVLFLTEFDPEECPLDCSRPCETICPASAISLQQHQSTTELSHGTETFNVLKVFE